MNRGLVILIIFFTACTDKKIPLLTKVQQMAMVDSIVSAERKAMKEYEQERLRDRMSIELKEKVDSIIEKNKLNIHEQTLAIPTSESTIPPIDSAVQNPIPL